MSDKCLFVEHWGIAAPLYHYLPPLPTLVASADPRSAGGYGLQMVIFCIGRFVFRDMQHELDKKMNKKLIEHSS